MSHRLFSGSVLGARPGTVAVLASGADSSYWVWHPRYGRGGELVFTLRLILPSYFSPVGARWLARLVATTLGVAVRVGKSPVGLCLRVSGPRSTLKSVVFWYEADFWYPRYESACLPQV